MHDKELTGGGDKEEAMHFGELSQEELMAQKKLLRRIDSVIMPMVVLVSLQLSIAILMGVPLLTCFRYT